MKPLTPALGSLVLAVSGCVHNSSHSTTPPEIKPELNLGEFSFGVLDRNPDVYFVVDGGYPVLDEALLDNTLLFNGIEYFLVNAREEQDDIIPNDHDYLEKVSLPFESLGYNSSTKEGDRNLALAHYHEIMNKSRRETLLYQGVPTEFIIVKGPNVLGRPGDPDYAFLIPDSITPTAINGDLRDPNCNTDISLEAICFFPKTGSSIRRLPITELAQELQAPPEE